MAQEQNTNVPTNSDSQPVSFADVSFTYLKTQFKDTFKVSKGAASQVVLGFQAMTDRLTSPQNEYQQTLYPKLKQLCTDVYNRYETSFLTTFESDVERQVFGANLNGNRNNGSLYRSIPSGVNRTLTYNYAQFGQLMRVLVSRLKFVTQRDPNSVQRYKENQTEFAAYQKLQTITNTFLDYLTIVSNDWNTFVNETRTTYAVDTEPRQQRQQRQQRPQRQQGDGREPRQQRQQGEGREPRPPRQQREGQPQGLQSYRRQVNNQESNQVSNQVNNQVNNQVSNQVNNQTRAAYRPVRNGTSSQTTEGEWQSVRPRATRGRGIVRAHPVVV
jgi:hypothetical protein